MFVFKQETLVEVLKHCEGVDLASYGKPRDAFLLPVKIPHWTSGFGGKYEMRHTNVPAGAWVAVGDLEDLVINDFEKLKQQLTTIDIYPTGHSGDFSGKKLEELDSWFRSRSRLDNEANSQTPICHVQKLTPKGLGEVSYATLVDHLADNMNLFKDTENNNALVPADRPQREKIVRRLLEGLASTVRYTRLDEPAKAYQIYGEIGIDKADKGAIFLTVEEVSKIIVVREYKNGEVDVTPLDRAMLGKTYATKDGAPLGERGRVELSDLLQKAMLIETPTSVTPELVAMMPKRAVFMAKKSSADPSAQPTAN